MFVKKLIFGKKKENKKGKDEGFERVCRYARWV